MSSLFNYSYALDNFGFGVVYDVDSVDTSSYFYNMSTTYPVEFATNFMGLGLPASLYQEVISLLKFVTNNGIQCSNTLDGICTHPGACTDLSAISDYYFTFHFTDSEPVGHYMRVPIAAFATVVKSTGGDSTCNIWISYLDELASQSQNIILGGMFFQEFFGVFKNDYNDIQDPTQIAQLFVGQNSIYNAYIGNEILPEGTNPFITPPTPPPDAPGFSVVWIVVLSCVCALLLGFLGFALYRWKTAQAPNPRGSQLVYNDNLEKATEKEGLIGVE